ncbi:PqqD family protein [Staphylococcus ursi]|uniref:PqqD family protein n=1 Tax=Staphylococcus sp. MI 10-1553 TaxID=1912064 RepID=UPI0013981B21|nr:PqqD family protein [Staphylococcus sp. MI 10-1553]QHW35912.1 PqqD family protein [Staphylococcus sp. MI 10-1553]
MIYSKNPFTTLKKFEDDYVLVYEGEVYFLEGIGIEFWKKMDGQKNKKEIYQEICSEFDVDEKKVEKDGEKFLKKMLKYDLIELSEE